MKKNGAADNGKQRFLCGNEQCPHKTFVQHYTYKACDPTVRPRIFFSIVNGSGTRAAALTLGIAQDTVTDALRSIESPLWYINDDYLPDHQNSGIEVEFVSVDEVETDEMRSFAGDTSHQYWVWRAIDHRTGEPPAFHVGTREPATVDELLALLKPFDITVGYSDDNCAYQSRITDREVVTGKTKTQTIARKHVSLRTWCSGVVGKGIRFSKDHGMHKIVIALVINFWFFHRIIW